MIRDVINKYYEMEELPDFNDKDYDPFWDPPEPLLVGVSYISLHNLLFCIENELNALIFSSEGQEGSRGELSIKYFPCDAEGDGEPSDDVIVEEPEEIMGKEIHFRVEIESARDLPNDLCKNVFVTY